MMEYFETKMECAVVEYQRGDGSGSVRVTIDGYWFSRQGWDELTAELFPPTTPYAIDLDVWLP